MEKFVGGMSPYVLCLDLLFEAAGSVGEADSEVWREGWASSCGGSRCVCVPPAVVLPLQKIAGDMVFGPGWTPVSLTYQ